MTAKQTNQLMKNPNTQKAIAVLTKYATLEAELKKAEADSKAATALIQEAMISQGVDRLDIDLPNLTGYITLAERTNYSAEDLTGVQKKFLKQALDTAKVKAHATLTGDLPAGVVESKTQYITKKFKVVE